jgi:hypothetical protein
LKDVDSRFEALGIDALAIDTETTVFLHSPLLPGRRDTENLPSRHDVEGSAETICCAQQAVGIIMEGVIGCDQDAMTSIKRAGKVIDIAQFNVDNLIAFQVTIPQMPKQAAK